MFNLEQLKKLLADVKALPDGWHPETESVFRLQLSFGGAELADNNCLTVKDKQGIIVCIIPQNHLVDCQMELASAIAIWRKVIPFLILDTMAREIRLNEIRSFIKGLEYTPDGTERNAGTDKICKAITAILDREIEEDEIENKEPETPGGIKPA